MKKQQFEIIKLSIEEILESLSEFVFMPFFSASSFYSTTQQKIFATRDARRSNLSRKIRDLKRSGYITTFMRDKELFYEITPKGRDRVTKQKLSQLSSQLSKPWDGRWRMVIFDIPEKHRSSRDAFRRILTELRFIQFQKSIYLHPFECTDQIKFACSILSINKFVKISISEIIQGVEDIIEQFLDNGILKLSDLKR